MKKLLIFLLLLIACPAWGATYYVDCAANGDAGTGLSTDADVAWKTVSKVNSSSFSAGDFILFKKGCTWREALTVPSSGSAGSVITFSYYGTGARPAFIGSDVHDVSGYTLTSGQTKTYEAASATTPGWVWENTTPLALQTSIATVEATAGTWWWSSVAQKTYIHASDNSNVATNGKVYEISGRDFNIYIPTDYITIDGIDCYRTGGDDGTMGGLYTVGNYTTVRNLTALGHRRHCASFYINASDGLFENMTISDSYVTAAVAIYGDYTANNTIRACNIYCPTFSATVIANQSVIIHGGAHDNIIENNFIGNNRTGVGIAQTGTDNNIVRYNKFFNSVKYSVNLANTADSTLIYGNIFLNTQVNLTDAVNTKIYNNTFYATSNSFAVVMTGASTGTLIKNNIIYYGKGLSVASASVTNTVIDYNVYKLTGTGTRFIWNSTNYTTYTLWKTASSQDAHSAEADPLFVANGTDFHLQVGSPAKDTGVYVGMLRKNPPDIGVEWRQYVPWR